jgi:uncharacterized protein
MRFTWSKAKRKSNLNSHGLDVADAPKVFDGPTFTFEDDRFLYDEARFVTLGLLKGVPVSIVHTEIPDQIRVISFRKATKMSKSSSSKTSRTDWSRVKAMKDRDIKLTAQHPEADVKHIVRGIVRQGLKPVPAKTSISLRLDADVLEWFKAQGPGYQTRMNAVLRAFKDVSA